MNTHVRRQYDQVSWELRQLVKPRRCTKVNLRIGPAASMRVDLDGLLPRRLRNYVLAHASHKVYEVRICRDRDIYRYEARCRVGWSKAGRHTLVGRNVSALIAEIDECAPCDCEACA